MPQIDLLRSLPKTKRNVTARLEAKDPEVIKTAKTYGHAYFDGDRKYGYGGYRQDGRWVPVARDIISHYGLHENSRVLDVGCAKGFLVEALVSLGIDAYGVDISTYAIANADRKVQHRLFWGSADNIRFLDHDFDLVLSINTIHNLPRERAKKALQEIERVGKGKAFVQVDSYYTPEQKALFEDWVLTAEFHDYPEGWLKLFEEAGYNGDYDWTIV